MSGSQPSSKFNQPSQESEWQEFQEWKRSKDMQRQNSSKKHQEHVSQAAINPTDPPPAYSTTAQSDEFPTSLQQTQDRSNSFGYPESSSPQPYYGQQSNYSSQIPDQQDSLRPPMPHPPSSMQSNSSHVTIERTTSGRPILHKTVAIPATMPKLGSPFLRAYPPSLAAYDISAELFLKFLDDLNRVAVASPPLQVLGLAGQIVGFVPMQTAQIVGGAVQAAATIGTVAVSKGRTELFMRDSNRTIFKPRGLKAEIAKIDAVAKIAGIPILDERNKLKKDTALLEPLEKGELSDAKAARKHAKRQRKAEKRARKAERKGKKSSRKSSSSSSSSSESSDSDSDHLEKTTTGGSDRSLKHVNSQQRRLEALEEWIAPLEVTPLPDINTPSNPLSKWSARASERQRAKGEKRLEKSRIKASRKYHKDLGKAEGEYEDRMAELNAEKERVHATEHGEKLEKEFRKIEKEQRKLEEEHEKERSKVEKDRTKKDKDESGMKKILWVIVRPLDADSGISNEDNPEL